MLTKTKIAVYDGDGKNKTLSRTYAVRSEDGSILQDPLTSVVSYNFDDERQRPTLMNSLALIESGAAKVMLHDLPAGSLDKLQDISDNGKGIKYLMRLIEESNARLTVLLGVDAEYESALSALATLKLFGDKVDYVAMLNMREASSESVEEMTYYHGFQDGTGVVKGGKAREELLRLKGTEVMVPKLAASTRSKVNAEHFTLATASSRHTKTLWSNDRMRVTAFRDTFREGIEANPVAMKYLGLDGSDQPRLLWAVSDKGGIGKSWWCGALVDLFRSED